MEAAKRSSLYMRNIIFGVEDSLVSTVGLLSGIAAVAVPHKIILMTGLILIFVEAVSMAVGSFLSEESAQEYEHGKSANVRASLLGALAMFVSYIIAGFVPLFPYIVSSGQAAFWWSIGLSLVFLGLVGFAQARISGLHPLSRALRMLLLGGFAIGIGVVVGKLFGIA